MNTDNETNTIEAVEKPAWLAPWKNEADTVALFRQLRPSFHRTTLIRMRERGEIEATKFADQWYYKPETAFPQPEQH